MPVHTGNVNPVWIWEMDFYIINPTGDWFPGQLGGY
jgi:hypothetical protein